MLGGLISDEDELKVESVNDSYDIFFKTTIKLVKVISAFKQDIKVLKSLSLLN